ncbi:MAG: dihydroorotase [Treponema sp.]|nr:dihydroorotase [Treponema sp.]
MRLILKNFNLIDETTETTGNVIIENGIISAIEPKDTNTGKSSGRGEAFTIDGSCLLSSKKLPLLMPSFVDLHAHFRDPGSMESEAPLPSEVLESASLSAAAGGFTTVVCMANTKPAIDTIEKASALKRSSDNLGLIDLYPVLCLSKKMEGKELSEIIKLSAGGAYIPLMLSEDGKDPEDDDLFFAAMKEAKRLGIPISCHCDLGGNEASAIRRAISLGIKAGCHIHIAHVSTKESIEFIRQTKAEILSGAGENGFKLTCEVMPHHLCLTEKDAKILGETTYGRVNPPLSTETDRKALIGAVADGVFNAIATDHAPHSKKQKEAGAPGFSGFETAFAAVYSELVLGNDSGAIGLKRLSSLMSAQPARLLGFGENPGNGSKKRGLLAPGYRADLVIIDTEMPWIADPLAFISRGKNSPFAGRKLHGKILMTLNSGRVVYSSRSLNR